MAAQWSAGGAACKEEDLGHQASVGGGLWKSSVGGGLWKPADCRRRGLWRLTLGSRPAVDRGENFDNQHMPIGETQMKSPNVRRLDIETLSTKRHNEEY